MVCLEKLDRSDFEEVYRIMEQSFPADERRKKEGQQKLLEEEKYELLGVRNGGRLLAFLAVWEFAEFVFIEHFAVSETARNSGIGGKMLEELARQKAGKVVLEVELPERLRALVPEEKREALLGILARDPRPSYQQDPGRVYGMDFAGLNIRFSVEGQVLRVCGVRPIP